MDKVAPVRSVTHAASLHDSASIHALTGRPLDGPDRELFAPLPQFYPSYGSAVAALRPPTRGPGPVRRAAVPVPQRPRGPVPGRRHPRARGTTRCRSSATRPPAATGPTCCTRPDGLADAASRRSPQACSTALERTPPGPLREFRERAYALLDSDALRQGAGRRAGAVGVRERYGFGAEAVAVGEGGGGGNGAEMGYARHMRGQNLLLARRLVEAGVPFVNVYDFSSRARTGTPTSSAPTSTRRTCCRRPTAASRP